MIGTWQMKTLTESGLKHDQEAGPIGIRSSEHPFN
uniref:Uncharacterized protein n=1 Tax=Rhizophora mucronata TaxID=61149 RepID=A0A2P2QDJ4_RHIMU